MSSYLTPADRVAPPWLAVFAGAAAVLAIAAAVAGLVLWLAPSPEERFDRCMSIAERGGLREERSEDAALICLQAAMRKNIGGDESGPTIALPIGGGPPVIIT